MLVFFRSGTAGNAQPVDRKMKPVEHVTRWTGTGRFAERSRTFRAIAQDGDRGDRRRAQPLKHAAQLLPLQISLRRHAAEHHLLPIIVVHLSEEYLERVHLIMTNRAHGTTVDG